MVLSERDRYSFVGTIKMLFPQDYYLYKFIQKRRMPFWGRDALWLF
jgi:hypothetical protein